MQYTEEAKQRKSPLCLRTIDRIASVMTEHTRAHAERVLMKVQPSPTGTRTAHSVPLRGEEQSVTGSAVEL